MNIAVMPGDGVGKEVIPEGLKVLSHAANKFGFTYSTTDYPFGGEHYLKTKQTLPDSALKELAAHDAILFGAVGVDPRGSAQIPQGILETEILLKMRFELDQYINLRPTKLLPGVPTPLRNAGPGDIDMVIVRENTEGLYCGNGGFLYKDTPYEVANQIEVTTRRGVERAIRYAFEYAKQFGRKNVTLVAKTNVLRFAHNLWLRAFEQIKTDFPEIETDYHHVDACTMYMVTKPKIYDVIVTTNMFGDIITDLGAAIQGGMGMAASGNLNPTRQAASMFEPVHGSTDIAGKNLANPIATFLTVGMMLDFLGQPAAAKSVNAACQKVVADAKNHTRDLGGQAMTTQVTDAVLGARVAGVADAGKTGVADPGSEGGARCASTPYNTPMPEKLVIIGSGPAAWTCAIYAARANLQPLVYEGALSEHNRLHGMLPLGQLNLTTEVENFPGFPDGIKGPELMMAMREQALRFGTRIATEDVTSVDLARRPFVLKDSAGESVSAQAVVIATGASANYLGLESEGKFKNRGVSACAVCDGALPRYRGKPLVVVGGGDSAAEEGSYLTKFASKIHLVHRREALRASPIMARRVLDNPKVQPEWNSVVEEIIGNDEVGMTHARVRNLVTREEKIIEAPGMFVAIGHTPNTSFLKGQLKTDPQGFIILADPYRTTTSVEGVFAAGDVADSVYKQAITAAGMGCKAALDAERWLAASGIH